MEKAPERLNIAESEIEIEKSEYRKLIEAKTRIDLLEKWARDANPLCVPDAVRIILGTGSAAEKTDAKAGKWK